MNELTKVLLSKQDLKYKEFSRKLIPDTRYEMIGVRVPEIKRLAKSVQNESVIDAFFSEKHRFYEEFMLHGLLISSLKNTDDAFYRLDLRPRSWST